MLKFLLASLLVVSVVAAPADQEVDYNILNAELDSILKDSEAINSMSPTELLALSERVDGTLRQLETIAEKRLGVRMDIAKHNRKERSPQEEEQQQGAAPAGQGLLAGLTGLGGGNSNLMQMLTNLFASLGGGGGQQEQRTDTESQE